ncbi:MAG: hypothetical protein Q8P41_20210 [Pseudomonadota bacterium]|nr:hypothetical protein [Pseudomonadota bacterium]
MSDTVLARLAEFAPTDATARLVDTVFTALPGIDPLTPYPALASVVAALGGTAADMPKATAHLDDDASADILWMSGLVDTGDKGYAVVSGVSSALKFFFGKKEARKELLDTDDQQRNDAVLKAFALAYLAWKSSDGPIPARAAAFARMPAGRALLAWYAAVEIALPFADNAVSGGAHVVDDLFERYGAAQFARLSSLAGGKDLGGVQGALAALMGPIRAAVDAASPHVEKVAKAAGSYAPGALDVGDKLAGFVATGADVMPVYRYLGARLGAEAAVLRSRAGGVV